MISNQSIYVVITKKYTEKIPLLILILLMTII